MTVTTSGGTTGPVAFTVDQGSSNPSSSSSISPSFGTQGASVAVTISGANFVSPATINVGSGIAVSGVNVVNSTQITATFAISDTAPLGGSNVTVTTINGTTDPVTFTITPGKPTLSLISPPSAAQGAVSVTLTGTNFTSGATVNVANPGIAVSGVSFVNSTQITATFTIAANAAPGATNVTVTTASGTSSPTSFTVNPSSPTLSSISPASGAQGATVPVTLTGTGFIAGATVNVANAGITVTGVSVVSATQITASFAIAGNAAPGSTNVTVNTTGGTSGTVSFTVQSPISVTPPSLTFSSQPGGNVPSQQLTVSSTGPFTVTPGPGCSWLTPAPASGAAAGIVTVSASAAGLSPGTYNCTLNVAGGGGTQGVFVTFTVGGSTLQVSATSLTFSYPAGSPAPASQTVSVSSSSDSVAGTNFTAASGCSFATVSPTSGATPATLTISVNAGLAANTYTCPITIGGATASNSPQVTVKLTVSSPPAVTPSTLLFTAKQGSTTPIARTISLSGPDTPVAFTAAVSTNTGGNWLSLDTSSGSTPANISVRADPSGLTQPTYTGAVTVTFAGGQQPVTVNAILSISAVILTPAPNSLQFRFQQGSTPPPQVISLITNDGSTPPFTYTSTGPITVTTVAGTRNLSVAVNSGLPQGSPPASIALNTTGASPATQTIPVTINVDPPPVAQPVLNVSQTGVTFSFVQGTNAGTQSLLLTNQGGGTVNIRTSASTASGGGWLSASCDQTAVTAAVSASCTVSADPSKVIPNATGGVDGTYAGEVSVVGDSGQSARLPVTMSLSSFPSILLSHSGLSFSAVQGGTNPNPLPDTIDILNGGLGTLNWTAQASTRSGGNWLKISKQGGTASTASPDSISVSVDATALTPGIAPGPYYGTVVIGGTDASGSPASPRTVAVVLNVLAAGSVLSPVVRPGGLIFTGDAKTNNVPPQTVTIFNLSSGGMSYSSAAVTDDNGSWCAASPATGTVAQNSPVSIQLDYTKLTTAGVHGCELRLLFADGSEQTVGITAVVTSAGGLATTQNEGAVLHALAPSPAATGCSNNSLIIRINQPQPGFSVPAFLPVDVEVAVTDNCGSPLDLGKGVTPSVFFISGSTDPVVHPQATAVKGIYKGTWTPNNVPQSVPQTAVTIQAVAQSVTSPAAQATVSGRVNLQVKTPTVISRIVNSASLTPDGQVSPCSWVTIFGQGLADAAVLATDVPYGAQLGNSSTQLGGSLLALNYVAEGQINAQIPCNLQPNNQHDLQVIHGDAQSVTQPVVVLDAQPALYTANAQGFGQAIIFWTTPAGDHVLADAANPVPVGGVVEIYGSGFGAVPGVIEGAPAPTPAATLPQPVAVTINDVPAEVRFAGLSPGAVGLYQVNVVIPNVPSGNAVPVVVTVGPVQAPQTSQPGVTIAVQ